MTTLEITLLGPFAARCDGMPITQFEADTARALLAYLALQPGIPFPRETLADLLWPELPRADALRALRQALNRLRTAIGDRDADIPYLVITRDTLAFNPEADYTLDVTAFREKVTLTQTHRHRRTSSCRSCMAHLEVAATLYRGEFLTGFFIESLPFEEWYLVQREMLHQQAVEVLFTLAEHYAQQGAYTQVCDYARQQLALEPWREEAHQQLIEALALMGQRSAALAQFETCCRVLETELGVEPGSELRALYSRLVSGKTLPDTTPPYCVPEALTACVGRETELAALAEHLNTPDVRLLTLVGPGGIGKTRLALALAAQERGLFRNGIFFVPLVTLMTPDSLLPAIAQTLNFDSTEGRSLSAQLGSYLRSREVLLILDSFEHLIAGTEQVHALLQSAPALRILITSRERLHIPGEELFTVSGLCLNGDEAPAVALFLQCARRIHARFDPTPEEIGTIAQIATLVQGTPLALELSAAWVTDFSCHEILKAIHADVDFLADTAQGLPERHRSLRAAFLYSWRLLNSTEQALFQQLAVFRGGFDRVAAQEVAGISPVQLAALADKSLVQREFPIAGHNTMRYALHELVRVYTEEKLSQQPNVEIALRDRHASHYLRLAQTQPAQHTPRRLLTGKFKTSKLRGYGQ